MSMPVNQVLEDSAGTSDSIWSSTLRHELANLMTIISGCCDLLEFPCGIEKKKLLDHIQSAVKRSHELLVSDKRRCDHKLISSHKAACARTSPGNGVVLNAEA
jgi:hypothetical protein